MEQIKDKLGRFKDAPFAGIYNTVLIIGAGGTGSFTSFFLSRLQQNIIIYDNDEIDATNLSNQLFSYAAMGTPKTDMAVRFCKEYSDNKIIAFNEFYTEDSPTNNITFSCLDDMEVRKLVFEKWKNKYKNCKDSEAIFFDARIAMEMGHIYAVVPSQIERYEETLYSSAEADEAPCGMKSTTHMAALAGITMQSLYTNWLAKHNSPENFRPVPFMVDITLPMFMFDVNM